MVRIGLKVWLKVRRPDFQPQYHNNSKRITEGTIGETKGRPFYREMSPI
jgi:hypothetical protein